MTRVSTFFRIASTAIFITVILLAAWTFVATTTTTNTSLDLSNIQLPSGYQLMMLVPMMDISSYFKNAATKQQHKKSYLKSNITTSSDSDEYYSDST